MGSLLPLGILLQVLAILHFIKRRPDSYWMFIIIFLGPLGAVIYIFMEVIPDLGLLRQSFEVFPRRKRIKLLEAMVVQNPSAGNYEELGDLYLDEGKYALAKQCYDKALSSRTDLPDPFHRRGIAEIHLKDFQSAIRDLEYVVSKDPKYDSYRAAGLLAHAYANTGQVEEADRLFREVTAKSTASETYLNYATFLASQKRNAEAREMAQAILDKKPMMPSYLRRRERPWFRAASALLKKL
jgi:hypothetical protein